MGNMTILSCLIDVSLIVIKNGNLICLEKSMSTGFLLDVNDTEVTEVKL